MEIKVLHYFILIGLTVFFIIQNSLSFNPIQFHCDNYVLNTYLYFILSWGIIMATNASLENYNLELHEIFSGPFTILLMVSTLALLVGLLFTPPKLFFTKHFLYIIQIVLFGVLMYPYYKTNKELFFNVALSLLIILIILTLLTFSFPKLIKDWWGNYLLIALVGLIVARLVEIFRKTSYNSYNSKLISYISIIIFSLFVMYDTKKIIINANNCYNPDYINESLHLFIDSINLFQNLFIVNSN